MSLSRRSHSRPSGGSVPDVRSNDVVLSVLGGESLSAGGTTGTGGRRRNYGVWRAVTLSVVYILMVAHFVHWKLAGRTLAPLEFSEVMHTIELGIVTAGFVFMCVAVLSTLVFGRFFCSWGCHILALQDLCKWLLRRVGIRPKPIRSRVLLWVPPLTALYLFVWPQVTRLVRGDAFGPFRIATDADGWASFVTNEFWRNLPGPWITALTFMLCGFVTVYLLGSRSFCNYVCPYGAVFNVAERFAPGRIRVDESCEQCGECTAHCHSNVRVHEEVARYGMVVNPACMKDLDCVSVCPKNALSFGFGPPALFKSYKSGRFGVPYDFSRLEEVGIGIVLVAVLLVFNGLYGVTSLFMALTLGGIVGYASVIAVRLSRRSNVKLGPIGLKKLGRIGTGGCTFVVLFLILSVFIGHSAFIRYHEFLGGRWALAMSGTHDRKERSVVAAQAYEHLALAQRWGLFENEMTQRGMIRALLHLERFDEAEARVSHLLRRHPANSVLRVQLGECLLQQDRIAEAQREFHAVIAQATGEETYNSSAVASAHQWLGNICIRQGRLFAAASALREAIRIDPNRTAARAALRRVLGDMGTSHEGTVPSQSVRDDQTQAP
ncbi:MAG: 4Fe-4S binding protein [Planctomycetes bacterium]|nr:4Fe-4S binding protein [Planctomycetota bacterium]